MTPGEVIRTLRIELDLSLREVSRASGLTPIQLGEIERGAGLTNPDVSLRLQFALVATMARLVEPRAKQRASNFRKRTDEVTR